MLLCMGHVLVALAGASSCEEHETVRWHRGAVWPLHAPQRWSASFVRMPLRHLGMTSLRLRTSAAIVYAVAPPWQEPGWKANIGPLRRVASFDALFRPEHFANLEPEKISALQQLKEVSTLHPQPAAICGHIARRTLHLFGAGYRRPLRCWQC